MCFFISFLSGTISFFTFQHFPYISLLAIVALIGIFLAHKKYLLVPILIIGVFSAFLRNEPAREISHTNDHLLAQGIFQSLPLETSTGSFLQSYAIKSVFRTDSGTKFEELSGKEIMLFSEKEFLPGQESEIILKLSGKTPGLNPGQQENKKIYATTIRVNNLGERQRSFFWIIQDYRYRIQKYLRTHFQPDTADLLSAVTIGSSTRTDTGLRETFGTAGLAHLLTISGTHFGLFSIMLFSIFRMLINALPYNALQRMTIFLTPAQAATIVSLPFMLAYFGLSGGSIPATRSFIMISLFLIGLLIGRKSMWLNALLCAACLIVLIDPGSLLTLSFQLSFIAVLFIGFAIRYHDDTEHTPGRMYQYLKNMLIITISATIGTAPLVAYHFHYFPVISPLSNLLITPVVGFILIPLSILSSFLYVMTGTYAFSSFISSLADIIISLVHMVSNIPFAAMNIPGFPIIIILIFYAGFLLFILLNKNRYVLLVPSAVIVLYASIVYGSQNGLAITVLDVGQGDSSVIELPDRKIMVIDTGSTGRETLSYLRYRGIDFIDALILSHPHPDHIGGIFRIAEKVKIREIWYNGRHHLPQKLSAIPLRAMNRGDMIEGNGYTLHIFHPYPEFYTLHGTVHDSVNNDSLVLKLEGQSLSCLFTGDIQEEAEKDIAHLGTFLKSDIIKVPHHGAESSANRFFLEAVSPHIAVISSGRNNRFGHPHPGMLDALRNTHVIRTDTMGAVKITGARGKHHVKTYRDFQLRKAESIREEMMNMKRLFETW